MAVEVTQETKVPEKKEELKTITEKKITEKKEPKKSDKPK